MEIVNRTPFWLDRFATFDAQGRETLTVLLKSTWDVRNGEAPTPAEEQDPPRPADEYVGEPGESGLSAEAELVPPKPATDVLLSGHAVAPQRGTRSMRVIFRVGTRRREAVVHGERRWIRKFGVTRRSEAEPFERVPLLWEYAYGGTDDSPGSERRHGGLDENPVGRGWFARGTKRELDGSLLPAIEDPETPIAGPKDRPVPVGFRPVAPSWLPRRAFAGTYDERWQEERAPLLPEDFDRRFLLTAPAGLRGEDTLVGGEECVARGVTPGGTLSFRLPKLSPSFRLRFDGGAIGVMAALDTVHLDADREKLHMIWRGAQELHGRIDSLLAVEASLDDAESSR